MATNYVGKRFRANVRLAEPIGMYEAGEEFTVTEDMVCIILTQMGPMPQVDFDALLATGAISPVATPAAKVRPDTPAGGASGG